MLQNKTSNYAKSFTFKKNSNNSSQLGNYLGYVWGFFFMDCVALCIFPTKVISLIPDILFFFFGFANAGYPRPLIIDLVFMVFIVNCSKRHQLQRSESFNILILGFYLFFNIIRIYCVFVV